jgi:hypothetical protein
MVVVGGYDCCDTPNTWTFGIDGEDQEEISTDALDDVYVEPLAPVDDDGDITYKSVPYTDDPEDVSDLVNDMYTY